MKTIFNPEKLSRSQVADLFDVTPECVSQWVGRDGAPRNGDKKTYNLKAVIKWDRARTEARSRPSDDQDDELKAERTKLLKTKGAIAEIDLRKAREEVWPRDEVTDTFNHLVVATREQFLWCHDRLTIMICPGAPKEAAEVLRREIHRILSNFAKGQGILGPFHTPGEESDFRYKHDTRPVVQLIIAQLEVELSEEVSDANVRRVILDFFRSWLDRLEAETTREDKEEENDTHVNRTTKIS